MGTTVHIEIAGAPLAKDLADALIGSGYRVHMVAPLVGDAGLALRKPPLRRRQEFLLGVLEAVRAWMLYREPAEPVVVRMGADQYRFATAQEIELALTRD